MSYRRFFGGRAALPFVASTLLVLVLSSVFVSVVSANGSITRYVAPTGADVDVCRDAGQPCLTIQYAINQAIGGDIVNVAAGEYILSSTVNINKPNLILQGAGSDSTIIKTSGSAYAFAISQPGVTVRDLQIEKTDLINQNLILITANDVTIQDNLIFGPIPSPDYNHGSGIVTRAMEISGGLTGLLIKGNTIHTLCQPAYINPNTIGTIENNFVYGTKGWVVDGANLNFIANTWGDGVTTQANYWDIALLVGASPTNHIVYDALYSNLVALSDANTGATIEDQRPTPRAANIVYVQEGGTGDGSVYSPLGTITNGLVKVVSGGTVNVVVGTYTENLVIDKALTLKGAQFNTDVSSRIGGDGSESTLDGEISIESGNVEINGFSITNPGGTRAIIIQNNNPSYSGITISNNIVYNVGSPTLAANVHTIYLYRGPDEVSILNNRLMNLQSGTHKSVSAIGILDTASTDPSSDVLIEGNIISDVESADVNDRWGAYGIIVNNGAGTPNLRILGNKISNLEGLWAHGIGLEGDTPSAVVQENEISNLVDYKSPSDAIGIFLEDNPSGDSITISKNVISNVPVSAAAKNSIGTAYVDDDYTADGPNDGHVWGITAFNSINYAIFAAKSGATINVAAGTYTEQVLIGKSLSLSGTGRDSTFIEAPDSMSPIPGAHDTYKPVIGVYSPNRSIVTVSASIDGFTIDGKGKGNSNARFSGVHFYSASGSLTNCKIKGIRNTPLDGAQSGEAVLVNHEWDKLLNHDVTISNNIIEDYQKNGITVNELGTSATVSDNTVTGSGPTIAIAQNGIQFGYGASGTITGNTVSENSYTGEGWTATGILVVGNHLGEISQPETSVTSNTVSDNDVGISFSKDEYYGYGDAKGSANYNKISDNNIGLENANSLGEINAENNWWESTVASTIIGKISGLVDFEPYYVDEGMTILSSTIPSTVYVDDNYADGNAGGHYFSYDAFNKIQDGINAVASEGTINVAAGSYSSVNLDWDGYGFLRINKPLTLKGAGSSNTIIDGAHLHSVISGYDGNHSTCLWIGSSDVNLEGLTVKGCDWGVRASGAHSGATEISDLTFEDVIVTGNYGHGFVFDNIVSKRVDFVDCNANANGDRGIYISPGSNAEDFTLTNTNANDNLKAGFNCQGTLNGLTINGGTFNDNSGGLNYEGNGPYFGVGIELDGVSNAKINGIEANGNGLLGPSDCNGAMIGGAGVLLKDNTTNVEILSSDLKGNANGILVEWCTLWPTGSQPTDINVNFNDIGNNNYFGIANKAPTLTLNAESNWWGSANGPQHSSNPSGTGGAVSDNVTFVPWCTDASCTSVTLGSFPSVTSLSTTSTGSNVSTNVSTGAGNPGGVSITFSNVTVNGTTSVTISNSPPSGSTTPSGFNVLGTYFDVHTTASTPGDSTIIICFSPTSGTVSSSTKLMHFESGAWVDRTGTINIPTNTVCSTTLSSLSPFMLGTQIPSAPAAPAPTGGGGGGGGGGIAPYLTVRIISPVTAISQSASSSAIYTVDVENTGNTDGTFSLAIDGLPAAYYTVSDPIRLTIVGAGGKTGKLQYTLKLPADAVDTTFTVTVKAVAGLVTGLSSYKVTLVVLPASAAATTTTTTPGITIPALPGLVIPTGAITGAVTSLSERGDVRLAAGGVAAAAIAVFGIRTFARRSRTPWRNNYYKPKFQTDVLETMKKQVKRRFADEDWVRRL